MHIEHIGKTSIESLNHAIGYGRACFGLGCSMLAPWHSGSTMQVPGLTLTTGKQPFYELLTHFKKNFMHLDPASLVQCVQKRANGNGRLVTPDLNKHSAHGAVTGHKKATAGTVGHLEQVFEIGAINPGP